MNGKKVLVTGSEGMLGNSLVDFLKFHHIKGYDKASLDVTDRAQVHAVLEAQKPDIIIHTAAYTNVEACEEYPGKAYLINTIGTQNLVNYCVGKEILFVYISSTGVYGEQKQNEPYTEFDDVQPTTIHHKSKYEAEKIVQNHLNSYLILRTGWFFGGSKEHNKNFVYKRFLEAQNNAVLHCDNTQIGSPTYILDFVRQIEVLLKNNQIGIFNCVNKAENISRYGYIKKIIELFELKCDVQIASHGAFKRVAPVSKNESAKNFKLDLLELNVMSDWEESLKIYVNSLKAKA